VPRFFVPLFLALSPVLLVLGCSQAAGQQPVLTGATPGRVSGGAQSFLIIEGGNFARGARVQVGQAPVSGLTWVNASVLTALAPANLPPGSYDLSVTNPGGGSATLHGGVTVAGGPQPAVAPASTAARLPSATVGNPNAAPSTVPTKATETPSATRTPQPMPASATARGTPGRPLTPLATIPARSTPLPAASGAAPGQSAVDLSGTWQITDSVTYGAGSGQSFSFGVALSQQGTAISGSGDGLSLSGTVNGTAVHVSYTQDNGTTGSFDWTAGADGGSLAGTFTNSSGNGGTSAGQRLAAYASQPQHDEKPPAAAPAGEPGGRQGGGSKKKR